MPDHDTDESNSDIAAADERALEQEAYERDIREDVRKVFDEYSTGVPEHDREVIGAMGEELDEIEKHIKKKPQPIHAGELQEKKK